MLIRGQITAATKFFRSQNMNHRIYGLETEYALLFYPENPGSPTPSQKHIYELFDEALQEHYPCAPAWYRKQGQFLSNSLLVHYEARGDSYYQGLIEGCTPECISPKELIIYQRALDDILKDLISLTEERLVQKGFTGRLVLGKNSNDAHGNSYGCHENYWVEDPVWWPLYFLYPLTLAIVVLIGVPIIWILGALSAFILAVLLADVAGMHVCAALGRIPGLGWLFRPLGRLFRTPISMLERIPEYEWLKILNAIMQVSFLPPVSILSFVLSRSTFTEFRRCFTAFVVTRTLFTGSGSLAFDEEAPGLHLSQRAVNIRSTMKIFWDDLNKPIFDIKNFIFEIGSPLRKRKRLHVLFSDSNMSEVSQYMKVGTAGLVLKMIEAGYNFDFLQLRSPVQALRKVSRFGHGALLDLKIGGQKSAFQIQQTYLDEARRFIKEASGVTEEEKAIVQLWEETLGMLDENPSKLATYIDWVAKKRLMDEFILERTNWVKFCQWGIIIQKLREMTGELTELSDYSFDGLRAVIGETNFETIQQMAEESELDTDEYQFFCDLFYEVKKIDLRYHEISREGGYHEWLEQEGMIQRISSEEELEYARKSPPRYTRAHIRGHYVSLCADRKYDVLVGWYKIRNRTLRRTIFLNDPFEHEIERHE